jgi:hypothetical protein
MLVGNQGFPPEQRRLMIPIDGGDPGRVIASARPLLLRDTRGHAGFRQYLNVRRRDRFFAETVHIDASLIRANVSMDARVAHHLDAVETANDAARDARSSGTFKRLCRTDPDATLATSSKVRLAPGLHAAQGPWTTLRASWWTWRSSWGDRHGRGP